MKKLFYFIVIVIVQIMTLIPILAQEIISTSTENKLISYGIDPENINQVIDSLDTENDSKRWWLIHWVREKKIFEATTKLKLLFQLQNTTRHPNYRSMEQKSVILRAVMELRDTSFQEEFREEIDSLSLNDNNYYDIMLFSAYLQEMHNDSYGWQYMKKFFTPEFADTTTVPFFSINIYSLKPFLNSEYHGEAAEILRYFAEHNYIALDYLAEVNDPETEQLAINMSLNHPKSFSRYIANKILKNINLESYIATLKASLNTVTDNRINIYEGLLVTGQPAVYKYVVDLYNSHQYPADSSIILQELENKWLLYPDTAESVINLLDSLASALFQFNSFGWLGNLNFVNELNTMVQSSKTYHASNDTVRSAGQLKLLRERIDQELRDSTDVINEFVQLNAWKYLYPRTFFIERRISSGDWTDSLISVSPTSVKAGSPTTTARIIGSGFSYGTYLYWDENEYLDYDVISPSEIDVIIPSDFIIEGGKYKIDASNFITSIDNNLIFRVLALISLNPSSAIVNSSPFTLTVYGHGFDSLSVAYFNDDAKTTNFISDSVLTVEISTSDISVVGSYPVWVADQWTESDTLFFEVIPNITSISPAIALPFDGVFEEGILVEVELKYFSEYSIVYYNDEEKEIEEISDSSVFFRLFPHDMAEAGEYPIWIDDDGLISDTIYFSVVETLPESIIPVLECVEKNYIARFGYINNNNETVFIPIGGKNYFGLDMVVQEDIGQPTIFLPGEQSNIFHHNFGNFITWILDEDSVTANENSEPCE